MREIVREVLSKSIMFFIPVAFIYLLVYFIFFHKKQRTKDKSFYKFHLLYLVFIYYIVCVLYTTLIYETKVQCNFIESLYNSNWRPLHFIWNGYENEFEQFMLNIIMFIPLGVFLPSVFPKTSKWMSVISKALFISALIEILQFLTGRHADINDLIANTMGAATGYALYIIYCFINNKNKVSAFIVKKNILIKAILLVIIIPSLIPITYTVYVALLPYGYTPVQSIRLQNDALINVVLSDFEAEKTIYKEISVDSEEKLNEIILNLGIQGDILTNDNNIPIGMSCQLENGCNIEVDMNVKDGNKWCMIVEKPFQENTSEQKNYSQRQLIGKAIEWLNEKDIEVNLDMVLSVDCIDNEYRIVFDDFKSNVENQIVYGQVVIQINNLGEVVRIDDNRVYYEEYETALIISSQEAIAKAKTFPGLSNEKDMSLDSIELNYKRYDENPFLQPVWILSGSFKDENNEVNKWYSYVPAVK